ncbi:MAG: Crossover junction endodeoxyribonuclease RuvC [Candidatus Magasanikbacteria bacterium GW2011_GWC2_37_14]|uniref:Crossover junction endodeoxyribonuclease RuvC n=1 Tax=Candidatus Magasanikbacteria bacterium GW2011_GWC2_37_14 TaxID=1619046 RepID=A0A0G0GCY2_9BACT|nr:MAG: Crossover junction endodeoxyribonuclease RuvC [Candidatus Magasanikbacteria bacterium GW2011_GWC2_37_14]
MSNNKGKERVLGIDPGFGRTGFGVIEKINGVWKVLGYGCIETPKTDDYSLRLLELSKCLKQIIKKYQPAKAGVEDLFFYNNAKTAIKVGQARGVVLLTLAEANIPVWEFTPLQVKQTITGYGKAEKSAMQKMVQKLFGLTKKITPDDAADALAVALTTAGCLKLK